MFILIETYYYTTVIIDILIIVISYQIELDY